MVSSAPTTSQLLQAADKLPAACRAFRLLSAVLNDPHVMVGGVADAVRLDGAVAARLLRAANSPIYRRGEACRNLEEAIARLGLREVTRLAGALVAEKMFTADLPLYRLTAEQVWLNSLAAALAGEQLALLAGADARQAYTLGLLHSLGRLLAQRLASDLKLPIPTGTPADLAAIEAWEIAHLGLSSDRLCGRLLRMWAFPSELELAMEYARRPASHPARARECAALHVACWMAEKLDQGLVCEAGIWRTPPAVLEQAGLTEEQAHETVIGARRAFARMVGALQARDNEEPMRAA